MIDTKPTMPRWITALIAAVLSLGLGACATLYTSKREWRLPGGLVRFDVSAELKVGLLTRRATIAVNGREILSGEAWFWSDSIDLAGEFEGLPINALCHTGEKVCELTIAGIRLPALKVG